MTERPTAEDELMIDDDDESIAGSPLDLPLEIELDSAVGESLATPTAPGGGEIARFVAESTPLGSDGRVAPEVGDDDPTIALGSLRLMAGDDGHSTVRMRSAPPALPASLRPETQQLPNVMLGSGLSTRGEITEKVQLIPKTHPMANSIAPASSQLSLTPAPRRTSRWLVAIGALGILGLGLGAAEYLQSRGEHHAASSAYGDPPASANRAIALATSPATELRAASAARTHADDAPTLVPDPQAASDRASAAPQPARSATAPTQPATATTSAPDQVAAIAPASSKPRADPAAPLPPTTAPNAQPPLRLSVGDAALKPAPSTRAFRPTLGTLTAAIEQMRGEVHACAGDAHGIADVVLTVLSSGEVSHVLVQGGFAGSPAGSCIARVLRRARVAPFRKDRVHVMYALKL